MNDFITLSCPSCGGKLQVTPNTQSLKCTYCGNEQIVRHDASNIYLESFAQCPVCKRNDEVKKVSAILANQTQNLQGVTIEKRSYTDKDGHHYTSTERVPFNGTQSSILAKKLQAPAEPRAQESKGGWRYVVLFIAVFSILTAPAYLSWRAEQFFGNIIIGGGLLWWYSNLNKNHKKEVEQYDQELKRIREQGYSQWQNALERWNKSYYCFRDDCVFIPGEGISVDANQFSEFVYQKSIK
ncbi:MAG: hypothetical protein AB2L18_08580 [Anaerolineaceae bacterium]